MSQGAPIHLHEYPIAIELETVFQSNKNTKTSQITEEQRDASRVCQEPVTKVCQVCMFGSSRVSNVGQGPPGRQNGPNLPVVIFTHKASSVPENSLGIVLVPRQGPKRSTT